MGKKKGKGKGKAEAPEFYIVEQDMDLVIREFVKTICIKAFEMYEEESELATFIKKQMDIAYDNYWHCVVGRSFGSCTGSNKKNYIHLFYKRTAILLFKCI